MASSESLSIELASEMLILDARGVVFAPLHATLIVADLHLEKGSAFARRGTMLPPYDTAATLERLRAVIADYPVRRLISLGDGFHDTAGARLLTGAAADQLAEMASRLDLVWLSGNHDPLLPSTLPGKVVDALDMGTLSLAHEPSADRKNLIGGHLHPKARLRAKGRSIARPCFIWDGALLLMPAFGSYTGGLNIKNPAIASLFTDPRVALLGESRLYPVRPESLTPDPQGV